MRWVEDADGDGRGSNLSASMKALSDVEDVIGQRTS